MDSNVENGIVFAQPTTFGERRDIAKQCSGELSLTMTCLVDDMENTVDEAYAAWPERLFVVDQDGRIAYAGDQGPWGFKPDDVRAWLEENVGSP